MFILRDRIHPSPGSVGKGMVLAVACGAIGAGRIIGPSRHNVPVEHSRAGWNCRDNRLYARRGPRLECGRQFDPEWDSQRGELAIRATFPSSMFNATIYVSTAAGSNLPGGIISVLNLNVDGTMTLSAGIGTAATGLTLASGGVITQVGTATTTVTINLNVALAGNATLNINGAGKLDFPSLISGGLTTNTLAIGGTATLGGAVEFINQINTFNHNVINISSRLNFTGFNGGAGDPLSLGAAVAKSVNILNGGTIGLLNVTANNTAGGKSFIFTGATGTIDIAPAGLALTLDDANQLAVDDCRRHVDHEDRSRNSQCVHKQCRHRHRFSRRELNCKSTKEF